MTAARQPFFYKDMGVPDTPEGRFELVSLHLFLALESLNQQRSAELDLTQRTIEAFVTDMDDCMREMGVGDLAVPKKVKRAAAAFYERAGAYRRGLSAPEKPDLEGSLETYVFSANPGTAPVSRRLPHTSARPRRNYRPSHSMSGLQVAGSWSFSSTTRLKCRDGPLGLDA